MARSTRGESNRPHPRNADAWPTHAFARRMRLLLGFAVLLGVAVSVLGILLQGASAAGVSLWASLQHTVISDTLHSRFGEIWGSRARGLAGTRVSAAGWRSDAGAPLRVEALCAGVGAVYLAMTPALAGHASIQSPTCVFFPSDVVHVLAASVWVGGVACLLLALPAATRQLEGPSAADCCSTC